MRTIYATGLSDLGMFDQMATLTFGERRPNGELHIAARVAMPASAVRGMAAALTDLAEMLDRKP
jgi:hypothetical protein